LMRRGMLNTHRLEDWKLDSSKDDTFIQRVISQLLS